MNHYFANNTSSVVTSNRILYTPSIFARSSLLFLQEIGELEALHPHVSSRSNLVSYLFFMVVSGAGSLTYNDKEYELMPGDCVFIDCSQRYSHTTDAEHLWKLRWIHFSGLQMKSVYNKYCERGGRPVFSPRDTNQYATVWRQIMEVAASSDYVRDMKINAELSQLLTLLMENSWHPEAKKDLPRKKSLVVSVKEYLDENYDKKITLDDLAARFFINKYYLTKTFKEQYGQPINAYLLNTRITHAKHLLRFSDKSIEEIGLECGLGAAHYFSVRFKEVEGVPPSIYREQW